jgi:zinc protease
MRWPTVAGVSGLVMSAVVVLAMVLAVRGPIASAHAASSPDESADAAPADSSTPEYQVLSKRPDRIVAQLPNGLLVIAQSMPTAPVVSVQAWVKTGSIYEQQHNGAGLSHFLEHLVSGGTTATRTEEQSNELLGRMGAQTNAATGLDTVRYYINTSADQTDAAIDLVSDWVTDAQITETEYLRERQVIEREFEMGAAEPARIFWKLTQQARYLAHPARHPTIGYLDEFLSVSRDEIHHFYKRMYVPNNMVFVVAGDIDPQRMVEVIAHRWRDVPASEDLPVMRFPVEPPVTEPKFVTGYADVERPRLRLAWPGTRLAAEGDYALDLLAQVLGQGELSRLVQSVRNEKQLATSITAYNLSFAWGEGFFGVDAVTEKDRIDATRQAILAEIERLRSEPVSDEELARAKRKTRAHVIYSAQTAGAMAGRLASDMIAMGDPDYLFRYSQAIQEVSAEELRQAAERFLQPQQMISVELMPLAGSPTTLTRPEDGAAVEEMHHETIELDNSRLVEQFERTQAEQAESAQVAEVDPVQMYELPNGLRLLVQRNTQLPVVAMQWYHLGGLLADEPGHEGVANAMCQMMMRGAGKMSADELSRRLEDLGAQMNVSCGNSTFYLQAECLADDWQTVLELAGTVVLEPTFDEDQWRMMQPRLLAAIDSINDSWLGELRSRFREAYFGPNHPWSQETLGRRSTVERLTADQLRRFHEDHLSARQGVLAVFGDIDPQRVREEVERVWGSMPSVAPEPFKPRRHPDVEVRTVQHRTPKPVAAVELGFGPGMARNNDDYAAMLVMTRVLSSFPTGWLEQELRGRGPGLVYAVGAAPITGVIPGYWAALFNTEPANAPAAIERTLAVIERIQSEPIDEATLDRARTASLVREALDDQSNAQRAAAAALDELYGVGYRGPDRLIEQIRQVDAEAIRRVAQQYLARPLLVIISHEPIDESAWTLEGEAGEQADGPPSISSAPDSSESQ